MQQDVRHMMSPRLETVKLTIQHVRNGGKRMPVGRMHMSEGPSNPLQGETVRDPWIFENVIKVVQVDEVVPKGLAEDNPDNCHKENTNGAGDHPLTGSARGRLRSRAAFWSHFPSHRISHSQESLESGATSRKWKT